MPRNTEAAWWDSSSGGTSWMKRQKVPVVNNSGDDLASGTTVAITVNTKDLVSQGKLQSDCDDLRVVHSSGSTNTEMTRYLSFPGGGSCSTSEATKVFFKLNAALTNTSTDGNYYMYYSNDKANSPSNTDNAFDVGSADALLVCPFDGTTTCAAGETPSTATGAIRYSGSKSALNFLNDDVVNGGHNSSLDLDDGNMTIEGWIYPRSSGEGGGGIVVGKNCGTLNFGWSIAFRDDVGGELAFFSSHTTTDLARQAEFRSTNYLSWHHFAVTWDGSSLASNVHIYIDGVEADYDFTTNGEGTKKDTVNEDVEIGGRCSSEFMSYDGLVDEIRISNIIRYTANFTPSTSPFVRDEYTKLLYHFDENGNDPRQAGKAIDDSGNGNHGTITGAKHVAGLVGIDNGTTDTGKTEGGNAYSGHEGIFIEEATTNKIPNPSFENSGNPHQGWTGNCDDAHFDLSHPYKFGSQSTLMKMNSSTNCNDYYDSLNVGNTNTHTLSAYVYRGTSGNIGGTVNNTVAQLYWQGSAKSNTTYTDMGGGWWRLTYSAAGTNSAQNYGVTLLEDSGELYIDGFQLEEKAYVTTYADGSLTSSAGGNDTYFWDDDCDGTLDAGEDDDPHNQCSTRLTTNTQYATSGNFNASSGSISFWFKPNWNGTDTTPSHWLFSTFRTGLTGANVIQMYMMANNFFMFTVYDASDNEYSAQYNDPSVFVKDKWYHAVGTWSSSTNATLYINGSSVASAGSAGGPSSLNTTAYIGVRITAGGLSNYADAHISDFRTFSSALTSAQVVDLYYAGLISHSDTYEVDAFSDNKGQDPVAVYHFDEGYSTTAHDSSKYGQHLTLTGPVWNNQPDSDFAFLNRSLEFDGTNDFASRSGTLRPLNFGSESFSVSSWFKHNLTYTDTDTLISRYNSAGFKMYIKAPGYLCAAIDDDSTWNPDDEICSTTLQGSMADGRWHHAEMVKTDSSSLDLYIDGNKVQSKTPTATGSLNSNANIVIGADNDQANPWDGFIDEVIIYPYARSDSQVKTDFAGGQIGAVFGRFPDDPLTNGLVGHWKMDEGSANTCPTSGDDSCDSSGNGYDGAWNGGATTTGGKFGNGTTFDGTGDYVEVEDIDL